MSHAPALIRGNAPFRMDCASLTPVPAPRLHPFLLRWSHRLVVLSTHTGLCNGYTHEDRMAYWGRTLSNSPARKYSSSSNSTRFDPRHVFVCVAHKCGDMYGETAAGAQIRSLAKEMTYLTMETESGLQGAFQIEHGSYKHGDPAMVRS
jgi:hypothetical protein